MSDTRTKTHWVQETPVLDAGNAYATGDFLGSIHTIEAGNGPNNCSLISLSVLDKSDTGIEIDFFFFNALPTVASADNAAIDIADAEMEKCVGKVTVAAADYDDFTGSKFASKHDLLVHLPTTAGKFYVVAVARGTATFAASDLVVSYHLAHNG